MHEPAGVVENLVQILQNTPILQYRIPPSPENEKCQKSWDFEYFQLQNTPPPPPENWNLGRSWHFDFSFAEYSPPPKKIWNYGRSSQWESMCGKLPHVETLSNPDNYSFICLTDKVRIHRRN